MGEWHTSFPDRTQTCWSEKEATCRILPCTKESTLRIISTNLNVVTCVYRMNPSCALSYRMIDRLGRWSLRKIRTLYLNGVGKCQILLHSNPWVYEWVMWFMESSVPGMNRIEKALSVLFRWSIGWNMRAEGIFGNCACLFLCLLFLVIVWFHVGGWYPSNLPTNDSMQSPTSDWNEQRTHASVNSPRCHWITSFVETESWFPLADLKS